MLEIIALKLNLVKININLLSDLDFAAITFTNYFNELDSFKDEDFITYPH